MKKIIFTLLICLLTLSMVACTQNNGESNTSKDNSSSSAETQNEPEKVSITHALGTVEVPYKPKRVAVMDMSVLDMMDSWGLGDSVVGMPKKPEVSYLSSYYKNTEIVNLGSVKEVDMEALNSLKPDVIFIGGRLKKEYENFSKIAPTIFISINNKEGYMKSFKENVETIASIFGTENQAKTLVSGFEERIANINKAASGKTAIVGMVTSSSFNTLGSESRCSIISNEAGFENLANNVESTHGDSASFELLLEKNPEYIFVLDRDAAINAEGSKTAKEVMENEIVQKTNAYKDGKIVYLTPDVWYLAEGGIKSTDTMIKDLEKVILEK